MISMVTYADDSMSISLDLCCKSARNNGVVQAIKFTPEGLDREFLLMNQGILNQQRGCGYWLWKPYIIYHMMLNHHVKDDDILIYADAGIEFVAGVRNIINRMDEDIFFFTNGHKQVEWCKSDVYKTITRVTWPDDSKQVQASVIFFKVNQKTRDAVKEWLLYCQMPGFIDDSPSKEPNYPTFAEHRHDQAILTCLQIKYGYKLHWWPTQYSNHLPRSQEDSYPVMFNHHRKRNNEW